MSQTCFPVNTLFYGDNLEILRNHFYDESIDLIYLDPPFNSEADYNILFKERTGEQSTAQIRAFSDFWQWDQQAAHAYDYLVTQAPSQVSDMIASLFGFLGKNDLFAYLVMMEIRLLELHRVLKSTGSIFVHCDPTASHYLKILMDATFSPKNFRNEIIWRRTGAHSPTKSFGPIHDTILFYTKTDDYFFNVVRRPYMKGHVESRFSKDETGKSKFTTGGNILTGSGATNGESGQTWHGFNPSVKNRHWAIPQYLAEQMPPDFAKLGVLEKLKRLYKEGLVEIKEGSAWPTPVRYFKETDGQPLGDIWAAQPYTQGTVYGTDEIIDADVQWLGTTAPERLGYQTQKPLGVLERIINSSCPLDGTVLDPFCGCGTTIIASEKLHRRWVGIDITFLAINLIKSRLKESFPQSSFVVEGEPKDIDGVRELAQKDRYQFQWWALNLIENAHPSRASASKPKEGKKGADEGVDGWIRFADKAEGHYEKIVIQVKSGHVAVKDIRELRDTIIRQKAVMGIFITLEEPTSEMIKEVKVTEPYISPLWKHEYPKLQILTIEQLLNGVKPDIPSTTVNVFQEAEKIRKSDRSKETKIHDF
jgi:site-specific DNA-methyltransferase (adenine-specific)